MCDNNGDIVEALERTREEILEHTHVEDGNDAGVPVSKGQDPGVVRNDIGISDGVTPLVQEAGPRARVHDLRLSVLFERVVVRTTISATRASRRVTVRHEALHGIVQRVTGMRHLHVHVLFNGIHTQRRALSAQHNVAVWQAWMARRHRDESGCRTQLKIFRMHEGEDVT